MMIYKQLGEEKSIIKILSYRGKTAHQWKMENKTWDFVCEGQNSTVYLRDLWGVMEVFDGGS